MQGKEKTMSDSASMTSLFLLVRILQSSDWDKVFHDPDFDENSYACIKRAAGNKTAILI